VEKPKMALEFGLRAKGKKNKDYNSFVLRAARLIRKRENQQEYKVKKYKITIDLSEVGSHV
jgi:hypothetical protein